MLTLTGPISTYKLGAGAHGSRPRRQGDETWPPPQRLKHKEQRRSSSFYLLLLALLPLPPLPPSLSISLSRRLSPRPFVSPSARAGALFFFCCRGPQSRPQRDLLKCGGIRGRGALWESRLSGGKKGLRRWSWYHDSNKRVISPLLKWLLKEREG